MTKRFKLFLTGTVVFILIFISVFWIFVTTRMTVVLGRVESKLTAWYELQQKQTNDLPDLTITSKRSFSSLFTPWNPKVAFSVAFSKDTPVENKLTDDQAFALIQNIDVLNAEQKNALIHYIVSLGDIYFTTVPTMDVVTMHYQKTIQIQDVPLDLKLEGEFEVDFDHSIFGDGNTESIHTALNHITGAGFTMDVQAEFNEKRAKKIIDKHNEMFDGQIADINKKLKMLDDSGQSEFKIYKEVLRMRDSAEELKKGFSEKENALKIFEGDYHIQSHLSDSVLGKIYHMGLPRFGFKDASQSLGTIDVTFRASNKIIDFDARGNLDNLNIAGHYDDINLSIDMDQTIAQYKNLEKMMDSVPRTRLLSMIAAVQNTENKDCDTSECIIENAMHKFLRKTEESRFPLHMNFKVGFKDGRLASSVLPFSAKKQPNDDAPMSIEQLASSQLNKVLDIQDIIPKELEAIFQFNMGEAENKLKLSIQQPDGVQTFNVSFDIESHQDDRWSQIRAKTLLEDLYQMNNKLVKKLGLDWNESLSEEIIDAVEEVEGGRAQIHIELSGIDMIAAASKNKNIIESASLSILSERSDEAPNEFKINAKGIHSSGMYHADVQWNHLTENFGETMRVPIAIGRGLLKTGMLMDYSNNTDIFAFPIVGTLQPKDNPQWLEHSKSVLKGIDKIAHLTDDKDLNVQLKISVENKHNIDVYPEPESVFNADAQLQTGFQDITYSARKEKFSSPEHNFSFVIHPDTLELFDNVFTYFLPNNGMNTKVKNQLKKSMEDVAPEFTTYVREPSFLQSLMGLYYHPVGSVSITASGVEIVINIDNFESVVTKLVGSDQIADYMTKLQYITLDMGMTKSFQDNGYQPCALSYDAFYKKVLPLNREVAKIQQGLYDSGMLGDPDGFGGFFRSAQFLCQQSAQYPANAILWNWQKNRESSCDRIYSRQGEYISPLMGGLSKKAHQHESTCETGYSECDCSRFQPHTLAVMHTSQSLPKDGVKDYISLDDLEYWSDVLTPRSCGDIRRFIDNSSGHFMNPRSYYAFMGAKRSAQTMVEATSSAFFCTYPASDQELEAYKKDSGFDLPKGFTIQKCCVDNETNQSCSYKIHTPNYQSIEDYNLDECGSVKTVVRDWLSRFQTKVDSPQLDLFNDKNEWVTTEHYNDLYNQCLSSALKCAVDKYQSYRSNQKSDRKFASATHNAPDSHKVEQNSTTPSSDLVTKGTKDD